MKFYELTQEEKHLNDLFLAAIDEETGEIKDSEILDELEAEFKVALETKSAGIIKVIREQQEEINGTENEIKRLQNLKTSRTKILERFKEYVKLNLKNMDIKKIETSLGTISLKQTTATDVYDKDLIPKKFLKPKTEYNPMKAEIKKAIESGEEVPGARLVVNTNLNIK